MWTRTHVCIREDLMNLQRIKQFTGNLPVFSPADISLRLRKTPISSPSFLTTTYTPPHPSPPSLSSYTPRPAPFVPRSAGNNDNRECRNGTPCFHSSPPCSFLPFLHPLHFIPTYYIALLAIEVYSNVFFSPPFLNVCIYEPRKRALRVCNIHAFQWLKWITGIFIQFHRCSLWTEYAKTHLCSGIIVVFLSCFLRHWGNEDKPCVRGPVSPSKWTRLTWLSDGQYLFANWVSHWVMLMLSGGASLANYILLPPLTAIYSKHLRNL